MTKKITIAIDAMGGDNSPFKTIEGVNLFIKKKLKKVANFLNIELIIFYKITNYQKNHNYK